MIGRQLLFGGMLIGQLTKYKDFEIRVRRSINCSLERTFPIEVRYAGKLVQFCRHVQVAKDWIDRQGA